MRGTRYHLPPMPTPSGAVLHAFAVALPASGAPKFGVPFGVPLLAKESGGCFPKLVVAVAAETGTGMGALATGTET